MQSSRWIVLVLVAVIGFSFFAGDLLAERPLKAPKPVYVSPPENFGFMPPPVDVKGLRPYAKSLLGQMAPPASWDWRTMNGVTSVKNQNPYGTCWAFATVGDLESKRLIREAATYDFSELNIVACNPVGTTCNSGGNAWISTNYLTLLGSVYETCNTYPGGCPSPTCVNPACAYYDRVTEWRLIANDVTAIKNAIMTYGPVYTGIYASFPGFSTYNGSGCLTYTGTEAQNHAVLIVGWDDAMCGGNGGWIVKNSWGTAWGAAGYFYIRYGSARVGENVSVLTNYKSYDANEKIYHYDEWGWWGSVGWGDFEDYALVAFTPTGIPPEGHLLKAVDLWAVWAPTNYTIEVYDDFNGTVPSNLLAGPVSGTKTEAGYYSIPLPSPLAVYSGNTIYIKVRFNTPDYDWPIPYDDSGPMETNKSYVSSTGGSGTWAALDNGNYLMGDVGIRARIEPRPVATTCSKEGDPALRYGWGEYDGLPYNQPGNDYASAYAGQTITYRLGPYNASATWLPAGCKAPDTLCFHMSDAKGWAIAATPPIDTPTILSSGYIWLQDVSITIPCSAVISTYDTVIAQVAYTDVNGVCAPECADCNDPNTRPTTGVKYYSADTLIIQVVETPPTLMILQDTLTLVDRGQTQAYVPFTICNQDECVSSTSYGYSITSKGRIGPPLNTSGVISVPGGECKDLYGILNAGTAIVCTYDTLRIIAWTNGDPALYDTCVQVVHVVEPSLVPLFTPPVVVILVLALVVIAAIFMRRRMRSGK
ncbi:MAG: lectin like domain-containing protein [Candidatus Krumholzibacteria bacterium]|nr:lectin like domain-containing protein [Candidatus Krumholzibacteria bacterium]